MNKIRNIIHHPLLVFFIVDITAVCLLIIALTLIGETILPGIIYRYVSPLTLFALLFIFCTCAAYIAHTQNFSFAIDKKNSVLTLCAYFFFITLVGIASLRYGFALAAVMIIFTSILFFAFYKMYRDALTS